MAYARYGQHDHSFICDTLEDLAQLPKLNMGSTCYVISEAAKYMINSQGEWIIQSANKTPTAGGSSVNLSKYATIEYVDNAFAEMPAAKMFEEDPAIMEANPGSKFGLALNSGDSRTIAEAMLAKGIGMYNLWVHKSNADLPAAAYAKQSSCRGLCCVDTIKDTGWYGWIILIDHEGVMYSRYIRKSVPSEWK